MPKKKLHVCQRQEVSSIGLKQGCIYWKLAGACTELLFATVADIECRWGLEDQKWCLRALY